ncbi:hypothetical protein MTO96_039399 [Rhipicephalus appendiculatus]
MLQFASFDQGFYRDNVMKVTATPSRHESTSDDAESCDARSRADKTPVIDGGGATLPRQPAPGGAAPNTVTPWLQARPGFRQRFPGPVTSPDRNRQPGAYCGEQK